MMIRVRITRKFAISVYEVRERGHLEHFIINYQSHRGIWNIPGIHDSAADYDDLAELNRDLRIFASIPISDMADYLDFFMMADDITFRLTMANLEDYDFILNIKESGPDVSDHECPDNRSCGSDLLMPAVSDFGLLN